MSGEFREYRSAVGWLALLAVVVSLTGYDASLFITRRSLQTSLAAVTDESDQLTRELKNGDPVRLAALGLSNGLHYYDQAMFEMLRQCQSREDFLMREGPRIAWSELNSSTDRSKRIGIYLPAGEHWLKYSVADSGRLSGIETARSFFEVIRGELPDVVSVELGPDPEVYQFDLRVTDDELPQIEVIGGDNQRVYENTLPLKTRPGAVTAKLIKEGFAFPNEFKPNDEDRPYFLKPAVPPICELGFMSVPVRSTGGAAMIRLWIESDARVCMPAIYVAANYHKVTSLRYRHDNPAVVDTVTDADTEFRRLFEPYESGSQRFCFREEIFASGPAASK